MIKIFSSNKVLKEILEKAFKRSFAEINNNIYCFISPNLEEEKEIKQLIEKQNSKILVCGKISNTLANLLGLEHSSKSLILNSLEFSHERYEDKSNLKIQYFEHELTNNNPIEKRYFYRFDFTDEWNNLGYGNISTDDSIWSISQVLLSIDTVVISAIYDNEEKVSVFSSIKDFKNSSVLYINREVSITDGLDWNVVEGFLSFYRAEELPCLPLIKDIPSGYKAVVSARLDCDQSIINSKPIVELYKKYNINISLAVATGINIEQKDIEFLNDFYDNGGAILSHTINHYFNWGENYDVALSEAIGSKRWLEENIINLANLKYAVSPFHSNKPYSIQALHDAKYEGVISGIIHNDPEYLVSTSGTIPFINGNIVTHSQQCMLHGDSYHRRKNSIEIEKESFKNHYKAKKIFGYLDHPFGDYDYGWKNEEERLSVHEEFILYINSFDRVKWMTCTEILDFVVDKNNLEIFFDNNELVVKRNSHRSKEKIKIIYKNKEYIC